MNKTKITKRAWEIFETTYKYPTIHFASIGRHCFGCYLKKAWREAKEVVRTTSIPKAEFQKQIAGLKSQSELAKYLGFRTNQSKSVQSLRNQLSKLTAPNRDRYPAQDLLSHRRAENSETRRNLEFREPSNQKISTQNRTEKRVSLRQYKL